MAGFIFAVTKLCVMLPGESEGHTVLYGSADGV
jgi:hypothetical protein